jgi:hypothetical protein
VLRLQNSSHHTGTLCPPRAQLGTANAAHLHAFTSCSCFARMPQHTCADPIIQSKGGAFLRHGVHVVDNMCCAVLCRRACMLHRCSSTSHRVPQTGPTPAAVSHHASWLALLGRRSTHPAAAATRAKRLQLPSHCRPATPTVSSQVPRHGRLRLTLISMLSGPRLWASLPLLAAPRSSHGSGHSCQMARQTTPLARVVCSRQLVRGRRRVPCRPAARSQHASSNGGRC